MSSQRAGGVATVMFTDVEASTELTTRQGDDAAGRLFAEHDRIVREQVAAHGGRHVRSTGDGFLVLFDSARGAVACALSIQRDLAAQEDGVRVRIGLNTGEVIEGDGELFGAAVNLAARVMERARGGQVLVTDTVRQLAGTMPDARLRDRGRVALKGFPERQRLFEAQAADGRPRHVAARRRRRRRATLVGAGLAVCAVAAAVVLATGGEDSVAVHANSVAVVDPDNGRVVADVPVGVRPAALAVGNGSVWAANADDDTVTQIGVRSRRVVGTVTPGISVDGLGVGPSGVWVADGSRGVARMIDPDFRSVARSVPLGGQSVVRPLAVTADAVWINAGSGNEIARVDPRSGRRVATISVGNSPSAVEIGPDAVWVSDSTDGTVMRIDPRTNDIVATIPVGESASAVEVGAGGVWVVVPHEDRVKRIDPASNVIADTVRVPGGPAALAAGAGGVWVTSPRAGTVARIDPRSARVTRTIRLGHSPQGVAVVDGALWVALQANPARAAAPAGRADDVLAVLAPDGLFGTDPAVTFGGTQVFHATCAMLLDYPDRPYPAGARLVPEVARTMPTVSNDRRTYTFRVRPGFRFSPPSNAPVTAQTFRRTIERVLHPRTKSFEAFYWGDIVGFAAFRTGRAEHLAGVDARGDRLTIRLRAASGTLPARLASTVFCAVPPNTPVSAAGVDEIPMAGPYYFASYTPKRRLMLRRNPNYGGHRPARFREIEIDLDVPAARALAATNAGRADYVNAVSLDDVPALERRYGSHSSAARAGAQRYFSGAEPTLHYFALNSRRPLLAGSRMRQAVNAALDRRALAHRVLDPPAGGPGRPTDQFTPPGFPGFRDAVVYPLGGPDLERARRLAGPRRRHAVLYTCNLPPCLEHGRVARRNLAAIGIDLEVKHFSGSEMFGRVQTPGEPWDLAYLNWFASVADPSFAADLFVPARDPNAGQFRSRRFDRQIRAATRVRDDDARARAYERLDADLARAGAAAPFATAVSTDFFSDRIGCQVHQPIYGIALGALCVRD